MRTPSRSWSVPASVGRLFAVVAVFSLGVQQLVLGRLVTRIVLADGPAGPLPRELAYLMGALFIALAIGFAWSRTAVLCGRIFAALCFVCFLTLHLRLVLADIVWGGSWTSAGKVLSFCALGLALASQRQSADTENGRTPSFARAQLGAARIFFAAFLIIAGVQHFVFSQFVQTFVPSWIPGAKFWTYFSAVALIAGGVGLLLERTVRLAALLIGAMIFSWLLILHLPRLVATRDANETTAFFEATAFVGLAWLLADAFRTPLRKQS